MRSRSRRRPFSLVVGVATALVASVLAVPATADTGAVADEGSRFTFVTVPDTQFYSRYADDQFEPLYGTNPYQVQAEWLVDVKDDLNIPMVSHLGDLVDRARVEAEWEVADAAHQVLEDADLPYSVLPGNHDVLNSNTALKDRDYDLAAEPYLSWFPPERAVAQSTDAGRDETGLSEYHVFEAEGQEYLVLALAWRVSDETLAWADQVMADHPTLPTILTTHSLLGVGSDGTTPVDTEYGDELWDKLIRGNDQIFLTINGHFHGSTHQTRVNDAGNEVFQVLQDFQMAYEGGNGYLGLFEFDLDHDRIHVQAASPWVVWKPQETLTTYDQPFLEGPTERYSLEIDFTERFAGFNPDFTAGDGRLPSLSERARDLLLDGFEGVPPVEAAEPGSIEDYPRAPGTVAHWRPGLVGSEEEIVVAEGTAVPDIVGGADMTRVSIEESGSATAEVGDVTIDRDAHAFSPDGAAVCFADSDAQRFSYLSTATDDAINDIDLVDGYTIETFVYLDESWTADANAWSKAFARTGNRSRMGMPPARYDYTTGAASLGFSNLQEFQWTELPQDASVGDRVSWSGEIPLGRWFHVALVNDPEAARTTMYVDGAPILRNATGTGGMSFEEGHPWIMGAAWADDQASNGWHGCVGETRIIDRPTDAALWLTQRPDVETFAAATTRFEIAAGEPLPALTGTGQPGATVAVDGAAVGETVVAEDGTWELAASLDADVTDEPGTHEFRLTHGFGERRSAPVTGEVVIPAPDDETPADPSFPDVSVSSPHHPNILALARDGILQGFGDGTFRPRASITRGQLASVLARTLGLDTDAPPAFADTVGSTHAGAIASLHAAGIVQGYDDGRFRPTEPIRRDHVAAMIARWLDVDPVASGPFTDVADSPYAGQVNALRELGVVLGTDDGSFRPRASIQRDQTASVVQRARDVEAMD